MKSSSKSLFAAVLLSLSVLILAASLTGPALGEIGIQATSFSTPSPTTTTTFASTISSSTTTTLTTTSTSTSISSTSTTTTSTTTSSSFSYTSSRTITLASQITETSYTNTITNTGVNSTTTTASTSQTHVSTTTSTVTSSVAKFPTSCLIATATFGSELSPEVQLLRGFRDNAILRTAAGSGFMVAFNSWYYSFSPTVASYLYTHPVERTVMKGVLYPLIGILKVSSIAFSATSAYPEFAALIAGLVASSLIGAFYLGLPLSLVRAKVRRLRALKVQGIMEKSLGVTLLSGLVLLGIGETAGSSILLTISSAAVILSTLFLSAAFTSDRIARKL